jgi:hypothetical protein
VTPQPPEGVVLLTAEMALSVIEFVAGINGIAGTSPTPQDEETLRALRAIASGTARVVAAEAESVSPKVPAAPGGEWDGVVSARSPGEAQILAAALMFERRLGGSVCSTYSKKCEPTKIVREAIALIRDLAAHYAPAPPEPSPYANEFGPIRPRPEPAPAAAPGRAEVERLERRYSELEHLTWVQDKDGRFLGTPRHCDAAFMSLLNLASDAIAALRAVAEQPAASPQRITPAEGARYCEKHDTEGGATDMPQPAAAPAGDAEPVEQQRLFIDCEFHGGRGDLISMALVSEDGREFYEVVSGPGSPSQWVRENVIPVLNKPRITMPEFYNRLFSYLDQFKNPIIVADHPADIGYFAEAVITDSVGSRYKREWSALCLTDVRYTSLVPHNALEDARAIRRAAPPRAPAGDKALLREAREVAYRAWLKLKDGRPGWGIAKDELNALVHKLDAFLTGADDDGR